MHHCIRRLVSTEEGAHTTQVLDVFAEDCEPFAIQFIDMIELMLFLYQNKSTQDAPKHYQPWKVDASRMNRKEMQGKSFHLFIENNWIQEVLRLAYNPQIS
jgi:hypothetical protein